MFRRKRGATMSLVIIVTVTIVVLGIGCYFLVKLLGGGREISNAADAGALNIAKQAIRNPAQRLSAFPNKDVLSNFSLLADNGNVDLLVYNRFVAQALIVALNAKNEKTPEAADNAKKVWVALDDVSKFIRTQLNDKKTLEAHFNQLASSNNTRMLGGPQSVNLNDYAIGFMHRGGSTNVYVDPNVWAALAKDPAIPVNSAGVKSPTGDPYLAGYKGIDIQIPTGETLTFSGVPVFPQVTPHLISNSDFDQNRADDFIANFPPSSLPPNAFHSKGANTGGTLLSSVACAVVGISSSGGPAALTNFPLSIPGGYIAISNGPSVPRPTKLPALEQDDIFSHELANNGIYTEGSRPEQMFTQNNRDPNSVSYNGIWDAWYYHNKFGQPQPSLAYSQQEIKRGDGTLVTLEQLQTISVSSSLLINCVWDMYTDPPVNQVCVDALDNFKVAYNRPGTLDPGNVTADQWTTLEAFKVNLMASRYDVKTCADVYAPNMVSGVKWFDHNKAVVAFSELSAPSKNPYNFGVPKTPDEYLNMIEQVTPGSRQSVIDNLVQRCQQIAPGVSAADVVQALKAQPLPLGGRQYLFVSNNKLVLDTNAPSWIVPNTRADGPPTSFGNSYPVQDSIVNAQDISYTVTGGGDGNFFMPYELSPQSTCADKAIWRAATGYNNLLGELTFTNSCEGGGKFCKPN